MGKRQRRKGRGWGCQWGVALLAALLSACHATARLSPEERAKQARWHAIDMVDVGLNLPVLIAPNATAAERRVQVDGVIEERLTIEIGEGRIETVQLLEASVDDDLDRNLGSPDYFSARMIEAFDSRYDGHQEFRAIRHSTRKSKGFAALVNVKDTRERCIFALVGYRMKGGAIHVADFGNMDTVVVLVYCHPKVKFTDFSHVLETVEMVGDRAAFTESLRKKLNALPGGFRGGGRAT